MSSYVVPRSSHSLFRFRKLRSVAQTKQQQSKSIGARDSWTLLRNYSQASSRSTLENAAKEARAVNKSLQDNNNNNNNNSSSNAFNKKLTATSVLVSGKQQQQQQQHSRQRNVFLRWTGMLLRWGPIGICVFGILEWQLHKRRCKQEQLPRTASNFQSNIYCSLPLRIVSRCWGWIAACNVPIAIRPYIYSLYANRFNVNLEEAMYPNYEHYNSLAEFFTRPLKDGVRTIDAEAPLISPADGKVLHFGSASNALIEQVKGVNYNIQDFLGPPITAVTTDEDYVKCIKKQHDDSTALYQCVIYLAPGDYHRFHSPTAWQPKLRRHFSGELLSVSPKVANWLPGLFCLNERVLYMGNWQYGFFSYTAVGATNVGSVEIFADEQLKTNRWVGFKVGTHKKLRDYDELILDEKIHFDKGDLFGQFNMGSTIVLIFEAPKNFKFDIVAGQTIHVGESLGHIVKKQTS